MDNSSIGPCRALGQSDTFFGALFLPKIWVMPTLGFDESESRDSRESSA